MAMQLIAYNDGYTVINTIILNFRAMEFNMIFKYLWAFFFLTILWFLFNMKSVEGANLFWGNENNLSDNNPFW